MAVAEEVVEVVVVTRNIPSICLRSRVSLTNCARALQGLQYCKVDRILIFLCTC